MRMSKILLAALTAALIMALGVGTASASRGARSSERAVNADAAALVFTDEESTARITCEVRLTISLNETIAKSVGAVVGRVTAVEVRNCRGGRAAVLAATLPWTVAYRSFNGSLPNAVTGINVTLRGASFLLDAVFGIARCLYSGEAQGTVEGAANEFTRIRANEAVELPLFSEALSGATCPARGRFRGTFTLSRTIRITLI